MSSLLFAAPCIKYLSTDLPWNLLVYYIVHQPSYRLLKNIIDIIRGALIEYPKKPVTRLLENEF